ncbi:MULTISPECIES: MFS transporter [unclassified Streptomyces]|uniref:MFS transporter n=1 Tax=unclassified Streptomyces TaxID=2593676 RepID=UPI003805F6BE
MSLTAPRQATRFGVVLGVVSSGVAMSNLDVFIVNVALPDVGAHYGGTSLATLSWILNAYAVVYAASLIPAGALADRIGPRRAYLWGLAVFVLASIACALAASVWTLVAARVVQAVGAGLLIPSSLGILLTVAPPERRIASVRLWSAISGLAAAFGPLAGGLLTQLDWRWIFLVNVPIGAVAWAVGLRAVPPTPGRATAARPDLLGAGLLTAGIALLSLGVIRSEDWGWTSGRVLGCLAAAVLALVVFVARSARHPAPVLPLGLLRLPAVSPATLANLVFAVAFAMMLLSAVLWAQDVWHWSPLATGLAIAPGPLMVPFLAIGAGPLARRWGAGAVAAAGSVVFALGIGWWILALDTDPRYATGLLPGMLLTGVGVGLTVPTLVGAAVSALPPTGFSTGSAVVTMARQVGAVLGVAVLVPVLAGGGTGSFRLGWWVTLALSLVAAAVCLAIPRPRPAEAKA